MISTMESSGPASYGNRRERKREGEIKRKKVRERDR